MKPKSTEKWMVLLCLSLALSLIIPTFAFTGTHEDNGMMTIVPAR